MKVVVCLAHNPCELQDPDRGLLDTGAGGGSYILDELVKTAESTERGEESIVSPVGGRLSP